MWTVHVKLTKARRLASVCIVLFFFVFFAFDLVKIQLIDGEEYDAASSAVSKKRQRFPPQEARLLTATVHRLYIILRAIP